MDKFKTVLNLANKQDNLGFGVLALFTAGGEHIFSSVVFQCPCNKLNFLYGMVSLLVPALALLLLGYILNQKTWKLFTGVCYRRAQLCRWRKLTAAGNIFFQISTIALVAPFTWIAVALLNGIYFECAMTGINVKPYSKQLCKENDSLEECQKELYNLPCKRDSKDVLVTLKALSQILGWLLIASIMLSNLLLTCVARCTSPISYLQLKFWRVYTQEECNMFESYTAKHARELAERNVKSFFSQTSPQNIITPTNKDWEKISSLYKFCTQDHYYSTLHRYMENCQETDNGMMRMVSIKSSECTDSNPAVLNFVDEGRML